MNRIAIGTVCFLLFGALAGVWFVWGQRPETQPVAVKTVINTATAAASGNLQTLHVVKKGESFYAISRRYGVSVSDIQNANRDKFDMIQMGQILVVSK